MIRLPIIMGMVGAAIVFAGVGLWLVNSRARLALDLDTCRAAVAAWERVKDADLSYGDAGADLDWLRQRAAGQR